MIPHELTPRQRLMDLLVGARLSSRQLAERLGLPERQVEEHLEHVIRSLARDPARAFLLEPSECLDCGFIFRNRRKVTKPSRCPRCRSESISPPRYGIRVRTNRSDA
ncbi:transcriptional regulator [Nitrospira tepida]|uniref:transcriptional regulator n=1 Tax=Nitrospira tepida TaxID=2973512 RepID=UPI003F9434FB